MNPLYPFRFQPCFRRALWGGRRLETLLHKPLPPGDDFAESWEIVDLPEAQSVVSYGPLAGTRLSDLVERRRSELLGAAAVEGRFPLLIKFLDVCRPLSLQVHPDDARAALLDPPELGKTEAWIVLAAETGSVLYAGLERGVDRPALEQALSGGNVERCFQRLVPAVGDCIFLPAGTPHAIGGGLLVAEIQQSSNRTYRLHDWGRVGPDGLPRPLHICEALDTIDFDAKPRVTRSLDRGLRTPLERLVSCDKFAIDRIALDRPQTLPTDASCQVLIGIEGRVWLDGDPSGLPLGAGDTALVPASVGAFELRPIGAATLLRAQLPTCHPGTG